MRIVLVGGGTGGHFYPLLAIVESTKEALERQGETPAEFYYIGPTPYDKESLDTYSITYIHCPAGKRRRYHSIQNIFDMCITLFGTLVAFIKLLIQYPDIIVSKGGYTSVPVVIAGWLLRIPIIIHESDAAPGRANKLAAHFATYIAISYIDTAQYFPEAKTALTGIPMRRAIISGTNANTTVENTLFQQTDARPIIVILGGSQGAERVNNLILESLDELLPTFDIVHQTGERSFTEVERTAEELILDADLLSHYHLTPFMSADQLHVALSIATVIVSRAGSGTIHEIAVHGKPAILIPIPEDISHDQRTNAYAYARSGAASVLEEKNLKDDLLAAEINRMINDPNMYNQMSASAQRFAPKDAGETIAQALIEIAKSHE